MSCPFCAPGAGASHGVGIGGVGGTTHPLPGQHAQHNRTALLVDALRLASRLAATGGTTVTLPTDTSADPIGLDVLLAEGDPANAGCVPQLLRRLGPLGIPLGTPALDHLVGHVLHFCVPCDNAGGDGASVSTYAPAWARRGGAGSVVTGLGPAAASGVGGTGGLGAGIGGAVEVRTPAVSSQAVRTLTEMVVGGALLPHALKAGVVWYCLHLVLSEVPESVALAAAACLQVAVRAAKRVVEGAAGGGPAVAASLPALQALAGGGGEGVVHLAAGALVVALCAFPDAYRTMCFTTGPGDRALLAVSPSCVACVACSVV